MGRFALLAVFLLVGCQTLDDVRASAPEITGTFSGSYDDVSACAVNDLLTKMRVDQNVRPGMKTAIVSAIFDNGWSRFPLWEATLRQTGPEGGTVELRTLKSIWGTSGPDALYAWPTFESCGVVTTAHDAPSHR